MFPFHGWGHKHAKMSTGQQLKAAHFPCLFSELGCQLVFPLSFHAKLQSWTREEVSLQNLHQSDMSKAFSAQCETCISTTACLPFCYAGKYTQRGTHWVLLSEVSLMRLMTNFPLFPLLNGSTKTSGQPAADRPAGLVSWCPPPTLDADAGHEVMGLRGSTPVQRHNPSFPKINTMAAIPTEPP